MPDIRDAIRRRIVRVGNPAAGADFTVTVPGQEVWIVETLRFSLAVDALSAANTVRVTVTDGSVEYFRTGAAGTTGVGVTDIYQAFCGSTAGVDQTGILTLEWPTRGLTLYPGHVLASSVSGLGVTDDVTDVRLNVLAIPTGPRLRVDVGRELLLESMREDERITAPYFAT